MGKPTKTDDLADKISLLLHEEVSDLTPEECYKLGFLISTVAMSEPSTRECFYSEIIIVAKNMIDAIKKDIPVGKKKKNILN